MSTWEHECVYQNYRKNIGDWLCIEDERTREQLEVELSKTEYEMAM